MMASNLRLASAAVKPDAVRRAINARRRQSRNVNRRCLLPSSLSLSASRRIFLVNQFRICLLLTPDISCVCLNDMRITISYSSCNAGTRILAVLPAMVVSLRRTWRYPALAILDRHTVTQAACMDTRSECRTVFVDSMMPALAARSISGPMIQAQYMPMPRWSISR